MAEKQEHKYALDEVNEDGEYMKIGGSPMSGIILQHVLYGQHKAFIDNATPYAIRSMAWSPSGNRLASSVPQANRIWLWDTTNGKLIRLVEIADIQRLAWLDDRILVAGSEKSIYLLDSEKGIIRSTYTLPTAMSAFSILVLPTRQIVLAGEQGKVYLINPNSPNNNINAIADLKGLKIKSMTLSPDRQMLAIGGEGKEILIWSLAESRIVDKLEGEHEEIWAIRWSPNEKFLVSGGDSRRIRIWNTKSGKQSKVLEGHTETIMDIGFLCNGNIIASKANDHSVRFWNVETGKQIAFIDDSDGRGVGGFISHPNTMSFAERCHDGLFIRVWNINEAAFFQTVPQLENIYYITAKLVLVGDSGVGKTGLGWRLAHDEFKEHSSTHGQQFWVVPGLKKSREDGTECEAVLWDLAGQHIYRSIHSIFLDNVDASLVLFDPTNRQEPLKGAQFWLEQLKGKKQLPPSVLVGARLDRGAPVLSQQELNQFCQKYGVSGGYIGTSAKSGEGLDKLLETLKNQIPWDQMTTTVTTVTFKRIKEFVLSLKEKPDRKGVLVKPDELQEMLVATDENWNFSDAEMMTAVGHLANHGYVTILKSSSGEEYILLVPELLASVASSIFLIADKHPRELGAINETELLQGKYPIEEFKGLETEEQHVLLDATVVRFLEHSICFRDSYGDDNLLIFPSLIKQKRPLKDDVPSIDDISYIVRGRVENIYASLVVLLGYTPSFNRINQWQNQAQYETDDGDICGFRLVEDREGEIELILYYDNEMEDEERNSFQGLFEQFLYKHDVEVIPFPPVICPNEHRQERATVVKRSQEGKKSIFCDECGAKTELPNLEEHSSFEVSDWLKKEEAIARLRSTYESYLVRVKGYRRGWAAPHCYISHAEEQKELAEKLTHDLADAGIFILDTPAKVESNDRIIIIDSSAYKKGWESNALPDDIKLIRPRLADGNHKGLIYINQSGLVLEHDLKSCVSKSFCDPTHYVINLFDLVLNLYVVPLNHTGFLPLRQALHQQWEQTLAQKIKGERIPDEVSPIKDNKQEVFISYAWGGESENLVNNLDQAFQRRGVTIVRDKRDLGFKASIKGFMETIGKGKAVILVISEKYLKSENCMFELLQVAKYGDFVLRIFPVILRDANIYKAKDRIVYLQYWQQQIDELETAMKSGSVANLQGIQDDLNLYTEIRANIARLTDVLQDMNTLTPEMHETSGFSIIFDAVMAKLEE